ncbi:MAG: cupin domain-containing protein [Micromonosporaceae bacterium]|nr:cupin domain-containing protein [Micromonosporaceae bacterium]
MTTLSPSVSDGVAGFRLVRPKVLERIALPGASTNGALSVMEVVVQPGGLVAPVHTHSREDETAFVIEGTVGVRLGGEELRVVSGATLFGPRGVPHSFWNAGKVRARILLVITPGNLDTYFHEVAGVAGPGPAADTDAIARHAARFGMAFDLESTADLAARHQVSLA